MDQLGIGFIFCLVGAFLALGAGLAGWLVDHGFFDFLIPKPGDIDYHEFDTTEKEF